MWALGVIRLQTLVGDISVLKPKTQYKQIYVTPVTRAVGVEVGG